MLLVKLCDKVGSLVENVKSEIFVSLWPVGRFARGTGLLGLSMIFSVSKDIRNFYFHQTKQCSV